MKRKADAAEDGTKKPKPSNPSRALYLNGLSPQTSLSDLTGHANLFGALEFVSMKLEKHCAFLNFVELGPAVECFNAAQANPVTICGREVSVGWATAKPLDEHVAAAVAAGATRCLFIAGIRMSVGLPQEALAQLFSRFGPIESVVVLNNGKGTAFVNMASIKSAMAAVAEAEEKGGIEIGPGCKLVVKYAKEQPAKPSRHPQMPRGLMGMPTLPMVGMQGVPPHLRLPPMNPDATRSIFLGNIPDTTTFTDVCNIGNRFGAMESVTIDLGKHAAFINFVDVSSAVALHAHAQSQPLSIGEQQLRCNWAKSGPIGAGLLEAIQHGATRNLYVGNLPESCTTDQLRSLFSDFCKGEFDKISMIEKDGKKIGFVNLTNIRSAVAAKNHYQTNPLELEGNSIKVNFAKEKFPAAAKGAGAPYSMQMKQLQQQTRQLQLPSGGGAAGEAGARAVMLGSLPEGTTNADICKIGNMYGTIESVSLDRVKKHAFINFIEPSAAAMLVAAAGTVVLYDTPLRVSWGKSGPMKHDLAQAIADGATRNLYVAGVAEGVSEQQLEELFSPFCKGDFDHISILREKNVGFVNMTNVRSAIAAKEHFARLEAPALLNGSPIRVQYAKERIKAQPQAQQVQMQVPQQAQYAALAAFPPAFSQAGSAYGQGGNPWEQQPGEEFGQRNPYGGIASSPYSLPNNPYGGY